jgi:uncharacterized protein
MRTIAKLFGRSPFVPLQGHMEKVAACVEQTRPILAAFRAGDADRVETLAAAMSRAEHEADQIKQDIRNHLPRGMFLPVAQDRLIEVLVTQDSIADKAENLGRLLTLRPLPMVEGFEQPFDEFVDKNLETFARVHRIIAELDELVETAFGGVEAERARDAVGQVAQLEHEADVLQHALLKVLLANESQLTAGELYLWLQILRQLSQLSNLSERLANRVRTMLEIK